MWRFFVPVGIVILALAVFFPWEEETSPPGEPTPARALSCREFCDYDGNLPDGTICNTAVKTPAPSRTARMAQVKGSIAIKESGSADPQCKGTFWGEIKPAAGNAFSPKLRLTVNDRAKGLSRSVERPADKAANTVTPILRADPGDSLAFCVEVAIEGQRPASDCMYYTVPR